MSINWPASPSLGQTVLGPNGQTWVWDGTKWTQATPPPAPLTANTGRNYIHNPYFNIWQRGAGPFTASGFNSDRWTQFFGSGDAVSVSQQIASDADRTAIGDESALFALAAAFTGTSASTAQSVIYQHIENVRRLSGKSVIVSLWARAATSGLKLGVSIDQQFGTGGSPSAAVLGNGVAATLSTQWARYSFAFQIPSTAGQVFGTNGDSYISLDFWCSSGAANAARSGIGVQSGTIQFWGVQLEVAAPGQTQPTPLEHIDPGLDLRNCQRFFQTGFFNLYGYNTAGQYVSYTWAFSTWMRNTPAVTTTVSYSNNASSGAVSAHDPGNGNVQAIASATGSVGYSGTFTLSADL